MLYATGLTEEDMNKPQVAPLLSACQRSRISVNEQSLLHAAAETRSF